MQNNLKEKVFQIISERQLCSYMNNTKWNKLITAIHLEMSFPPAFVIKYLTQETVPHSLMEISDVDYWGDWSGENFPTQEYYFHIEWIKIRPRYLKYRGKIIDPALIDESHILNDILKRYHISFEEENGLYCIYGYR